MIYNNTKLLSFSFTFVLAMEHATPAKEIVDHLEMFVYILRNCTGMSTSLSLDCQFYV